MDLQWKYDPSLIVLRKYKENIEVILKYFSDVRMFWEYPEKMLILPLGKRAYAIKEQARSACRLEEKCTGISYWNHEYIPVSGKELILAGSKHDTTFMKTGNCHSFG